MLPVMLSEACLLYTSDKAGVDRDLKVKDWTDDQAAKIREIIGAEYKVEGDLRSEVQLKDVYKRQG